MKEIKLNISLEKEYGEKSLEINGELDSIIVNGGKIDISIQSKYGYVIFESVDAIEEITYIPIRIQALNPLGHLINRGGSKFKLNETIIIKIRQYKVILGQPQEVKLIIRYD